MRNRLIFSQQCIFCYFNDYARANVLLLICFLSQKMSQRLIACTINCHGYCSILYQNAACLNLSALLIIQRKKCLLQKQFCSIVKYWIPHQSCKIRIRSKVVHSLYCMQLNINEWKVNAQRMQQQQINEVIYAKD